MDEPGNKHFSGPKVKPEDITPLSEDDHIYDVIPAGDSETNNQSSCQDNLLSGNNYDTIPLSQGHALSNCKIANMSKKNPDPGYCMYLDPVSFYHQHENNFSMKLPSEDDHGYEGIPFDDSETKNPSSCQDCVLSGNNYCTIPLSQGHVLSNCKMVNMSKKNPDPGNSMHEEPVSFYNQYETDVSMGLPSTQKSEEMVAVGKPPAPTIRLQDIGGPCDNKILKPVNSTFDIYSLSVKDIGQYLHILNIGQYAAQLADANIDGIFLKELDEKVLVEEFGFKRFQARKLMIFARHGYLPKSTEEKNLRNQS